MKPYEKCATRLENRGDAPPTKAYVASLVEGLKRSGVEAIWHSAVTPKGVPLFPSAIFPDHHPQANREAFRHMLDEVHAVGVPVLSWYPMHLGGGVLQSHPEWQMQCHDIPGQNPNHDGDVFYACYNSPYGKLLPQFAAEIVRDLGFDGIWFDGATFSNHWTGPWFTPGCKCEFCRARFRRDTVLPTADDAVAWCHRNRASCWAATLEHQDMGGWMGQGTDPLLHRTFGALLHGAAMVRDGDCALRTAAPQTRMALAIHPLTAQTDTLEQWIAALAGQIARTDAVKRDVAFAEHTAWWQTFWRRSWIRVWGTPEAETVSRGYELQRFVNACGGRGAFPIKFNGSIFTVDAREKNEIYDADYRRWGGGYWFQNTRLTYWPMIMSGDLDLMEPWFRMYLDALPFAMARAKANFGIENAAMFPETMTFWGTFLNSNYGYNRAGLRPGLSENTYIRRYWQGMLELLAVLLDAYAVSGDDALLHDTLLVLAPPILRFYRDYYPRRDDEGKMLIKPSQSLETWHVAVNPAPDIAGLQWVLDGLLALPAPAVPADRHAEWCELRSLLPPLPTRSYHWEKRKEVIPALQYDDCKNSENAALYAVFPYRLFGVGKPELDVGRATWVGRPVKATGGWRQDAIQAALLGLTDEAKAAVVTNFSTSHAGSRFPAFWGPNFDWIPDQDHGSAACIALQRMVLQADQGKIHLLPAWPRDWNVEFKLHAPGRTIVEGIYRGGTLERVDVTPQERATDLIMGGAVP